MVTVALSQVKPGDKLAEDVITSFGGTLFHKGKVITPREIDILQAFCIETVTLSDPANILKQTRQEIREESAQAKPASAPSPFQTEYERMVALLKRAFPAAAADPLPVMDIRAQLEKVLEHIGSYNPLTFMPRNFQEQDYGYHNSVACAFTSYLIAQWVGLPQKDWMPVAISGLLHDIGNVRIDQHILSKPSELSAAEMEEMKRHTVHGYQLLKNVAVLNEGVKFTALQHHERVDGTGYPLGISGDNIHIYAKIVAIADIFHAMTMNKSYRKGVSPYLVLEQIQSDAFGKLEPAYVTTFVDKVTKFHNGTIVRLNDDRVGEIVFSDRVYPTRPWVSINGKIVNLTVERQYHIKEVLK